jgi:hypothetical protein
MCATWSIAPSPQCTVALNTHPVVSPLIENVTVNTPSRRHWVAGGQGDCACSAHIPFPCDPDAEERAIAPRGLTLRPGELGADQLLLVLADALTRVPLASS